MKPLVPTLLAAVALAPTAAPAPADPPETGLTRLTGHTNTVLAVAVSPDGKSLASAGADKSIRFWEVATGKPGRVIRHTHEVYALAFSPDGKRLASGGADRAVTLWDVASGEPAVT